MSKIEIPPTKSITLSEINGQWKVTLGKLFSPFIVGDLAKIQRALRIAQRLYVKGINLDARTVANKPKETSDVN